MERGAGRQCAPDTLFLVTQLREKDTPKDLREKLEDQSVSRYLPQMFLFSLSLIVVKGAKQFE